MSANFYVWRGVGEGEVGSLLNETGVAANMNSDDSATKKHSRRTTVVSGDKIGQSVTDYS